MLTNRVSTMHNELQTQIEQAYAHSGNSLGWRLLYSPVKTLEEAKVAFIGLNPGGNVAQPEHDGLAAPDSQSAYVNESWKGYAPGQSLLQLQVRSLFERLGVEPQDVLAGNIVPFRSPSFKKLKEKQMSLEFGHSLWQRIIQRAKPKLIVCMGNDAENQLIEILGASNPRSELVGWGPQVGRRYTFDGGTFVRLPHLSRFSIIKRAASQNGLDQLFS